MKSHTSLCTQYLLFTVSVLAVCTQHVCGDDTNYNKDDSCSEEFLQDEVVDQRLFPRSVETNHTQRNPHGAMNNLSQVESDNFSYRSNRVHCNHHVLPQDHYEKRSGMYAPRCVFPFTYNGRTYNECIVDEWHGGKAWCATLVRHSDRQPIASTWCNVHPFYDVLHDNPPIVRAEPDDEMDCIFPFVYQNFIYYECMRVDSPKRWCPTMLSISGEALMSRYCGRKVTDEWNFPPPKMRFLVTPLHNHTVCKFPFEFEGITYHDCTTHRRQIPWCGVRNLNGALVASAYCSYFWETDPYPNEITPVELTEQGSEEMHKYGCRFPFVYKGVAYSVCTNDHSSDPTFFWCASDIDEQHIVNKSTWCHSHSLPPVAESHCHDCIRTMRTGCKVPYKYEGSLYHKCESHTYIIHSCPTEVIGRHEIKRIAPCSPTHE